MLMGGFIVCVSSLVIDEIKRIIKQSEIMKYVSQEWLYTLVLT